MSGSMIRINGLFHQGFLSTDPITFDPNFQPDIQVLLMVLESGDRKLRAEEYPIFHWVSYYNRWFFSGFLTHQQLSPENG